MSLLSPWWLLLVPLGYLVIILHTLHPERNKVVVPSTLLWQRVVRELAADARWRRIVANLLLLLQLAALAFLMIALTKPAFMQKGLLHDIVLIDTSASMTATDVTPNRLEAAKANLLKLLAEEKPNRLTVIEAGPQPRVLKNAISADSAKSLLQQVRPSHGETDWDRTATLLRAAMTGNTHILLVTDGALSSEQIQPVIDVAADVPVQLVKTSGTGGNVGVVSFEARQVGMSLTECEVLITVANYTEDAATIPVVVRNQKQEIHRSTIDLDPGERGNIVFPYTFLTQDILEADLEWSGPDALPADNVAYLTAYPPEPTRVLLVGPGNYHLEQGLRVFPQVRLEKRLLPPTTSDYPLVIFDRMPIPEDFTGTALYLAGAPADRARGEWSQPEVIRWDRSDELTRFVDWSDIAISRAYFLPPQVGARVLVEAGRSPLVQMVTNEDQRVLEVAFRLEESDWPYRVSFPVFLHHLLQWAHPEGWTYIRPPLQAGRAFNLPQVLQNSHGWSVKKPSGEVIAVPPSKTGTFSDTLLAGIYSVQAAQGELPVAVNAGNLRESDIASHFTLPTVAPQSRESQLWSPLLFWKWFAALAFLLLLLEEWLYIHKSRRPTNLRLPRFKRFLNRREM